MSETSELLWVSVPGGFQQREAVLRVLIMPRLLGSDLANEGLEHWPPPSLASATLAVDFCQVLDGDLATVDVPPPHIQTQPDLWEAFFNSNTDVIPARRRGEATPTVQVADTSRDAADIQTTFETVARSEVTEDSSAALHAAVREELKNRWSGERRRPRRSPVTPALRTSTPPDFHRTLALLREHPAVLRALGLIIELRLLESDLPEEVPEGFLRVHWPGAPEGTALPQIVSPWTRFGPEFLPASTRNISAGMVTLTDDRDPDGTPDDGVRWEVVKVDVDGGVVRLRDAARALVAPANGASPEDSAAPPGETSPATLPALRTAGLMLVRRGRQHDFTTRRQAAERNSRRASMNEAVLDADDLVLGYRLDISRSSGRWRSLHKRTATYFIAREPQPIVIGSEEAEEGHVKAHAAVNDGDGQLHTDEVVARWSGWSLAVPQPALDAPSGRPRPTRQPGLPFDFHWEFAVPPGSLPLLRFTSTYRIRARVADLAGGGLDLDDPAADRCATEEIVYQRFEPISSPDLTLPNGLDPNALGPAESVDHVVIRSDGQGVAAFLSQNPQYKSNPSRVLLPPRVSLALAEQHGKLDQPADVDAQAWDEQTWTWVTRAMASSAGDVLLPDPAAGGVCAFPRPEPGGLNARRASRPWSEPWPDLKPKQIQLLEREAGAAGAGNPLTWVQGSDGLDRLEVRLAKAEQLTLEISSFMQDDFLDHFAIKDKDPLPAVSEKAARLGRHPMVTPARTLTLVHAVRRPINDPAGSLDTKRESGQTFAILDPEPDRLNLDPNSTAQLEITAAWMERNDDATQELSGVPVQTVIVNRGDQVLKDPLRHEFGDTRHRRVRYTLTAVSRFRRFFRADEPADAFLARTPLAAVSIPSSARPAPPVVLSAFPTFRWEEALLASFPPILERRRLAGLRVELQRPWFQTGEGEMLAVLVGMDNDPPGQLRPFLTQVGRDPIWDTPSPDHWPTAQSFTTASSEPVEVFLKEAGMSVIAVPHEVWFHDGRWYADIALTSMAASSYSPFIQLAVARFQPNSLPGLELSRVVHTEMVSLLPDRTLTANRLLDFENVVEVTLSGTGPSGPRPNRVDVIVEQLVSPPGMPTGAADLAVLDGTVAGEIPAWVLHDSASGDLGNTVAVTLPLAEAGPFTARVRVREVERIGPDGVVPAAQAGTEAELTERTVFSHVFTTGVLE